MVEAAKGKLSYVIPANIAVEVKDGLIKVSRSSEEKLTRCLHGTSRAHIKNLIVGTTQGFKKELDVIGVGYKAQMKGKNLVLNVGFSHPVEMEVPADIKVTVPLLTHIVVEGTDKQRLGQFAAKIRKVLPPEPYKGKGIRYTGEEVRKKLGKALAK